MTVNIHQIARFINHFFIAKRNGHGIHSPFAYRLCEEVFYNPASFYDLERLESVRAGLLSDTRLIDVEEHGAGSKTFKGRKRRICDIASKGISTRKQSEILYKLMHVLNPRNGIELGTSLGLNTLYMASVNKETDIITIEGGKDLLVFAEALAKQQQTGNIRFIHDTFDAALPRVLDSLNTLDLLYVDGNHTREATLHYFNMALAKKHHDSVFIFDDIYWSPGMTTAWKEIKKHPAVTLSIDTFFTGLVFFKKEIKEKSEIRLYV